MSRGIRLPTKAWQPLAAALVILGIPAAAAAEWRHLVLRHPVVALMLAVGWLIVCGACVMARQALSGPARRRLEQAGNAADRAAGWWLSAYGRRYRQWMLDSGRYIDMKGLATGGDHTPELDEVYVDVALVRRAPHQVSGNPLRSVPEDVAGRHSVSEFLDSRERVVLAVSGPPGSGKSTLLAHVARRSAKAGRQNRRRVPILLALRKHAGVIAAGPATPLPDVVRPAAVGVPGKEPEGWWERQLRRGRCTILFDGLDEVANEKDRRVVATWIEQQINNYPDNHFMITSRPYGLPGPVIAQADILAVRPFTVEQVRLFLNRWCLAAERHATGAASRARMRAVRIRADESAIRLFTLLQANSALYDLTVNPLLLTMIATVHRYRGALPGSRADLYGEICQVLLSRRIQAKDLPEILPWPAKQKLLTALAYHMMLKRVGELPVGQIVGVLEPLLHRLPQSVTAQSFLDDISRNGLLMETAPGRYAFTHLTFQEYLAARHIDAGSNLAKTLVSAVGDLWWRETTVLYAATADADQIVSACLDTGTMPALSLAFECAEISSELAIGLRRRLDQVRDEVYEHKGDPEQRRLIAAVLAASLARETIATSSGTRICRHPVNADLYWAFLEDSQSPQPDNPCEPGLGRLATGIRESEALAFVKWLNALNTDTIQGEFRLPHEYELNEHAVADALARQLPGAVTGAWTQPRQQATTAELWIPPGRPNPHLISGDTIQQVIFSDTGNTEILRQILAATASTSAYELYQSLSQARDLALNLAEIKARHLSRDLSATTNAIAREFASAKAHDLTDALGRDLNRAQQILRLRDQARALTDDLNTALYFDRAKDRDRVRELARYISLKGEIVNGLALDRRLANAIDLDLARLRDLDRDFARVRASDHFRDRTLGLGRTDRLARDLGLDCTIILANDLHRGLRFILARARSHARDLAHELGRI